MSSSPHPAEPPLLVVSAFAPELAPLRRQLRRAGPRDAIIAGRLICQPVGVGLVAAAVGATRALAAWSPRAIVFVGTAGAYAPSPAIGTVGIADQIMLASTAAARGDGFLPAPMPTRLATSPSVSRQLLAAAVSLPRAVARRVNVANPLAITRSLALARRLALGTGAEAENLEVFAVASAARSLRVPFAAVLGIANRVGPAGHRQWMAHQREATRAACAVVMAFIEATIVLREP